MQKLGAFCNKENLAGMSCCLTDSVESTLVFGMVIPQSFFS